MLDFDHSVHGRKFGNDRQQIEQALEDVKSNRLVPKRMNNNYGNLLKSSLTTSFEYLSENLYSSFFCACIIGVLIVYWKRARESNVHSAKFD